MSPSNYSSMILLGYHSQRPASAARTEVHLYDLLSINQFTGLCARSAGVGCPKSFDRTAHLVYMLINVKGSPVGLLVRKASESSSIIT